MIRTEKEPHGFRIQQRVEKVSLPGDQRRTSLATDIQGSSRKPRKAETHETARLGIRPLLDSTLRVNATSVKRMHEDANLGLGPHRTTFTFSGFRKLEADTLRAPETGG